MEEEGIPKSVFDKIIEAKDNDKELFLSETADLLYHLLVLLSAKDLRIENIIDILKERHK